MPRVVPAVGLGPYLQANRSVAAGGPQQAELPAELPAEPPAAPQPPAGLPAGGLQVAGMQLSPELLAGLSFENGALKIPQAKIQELITRFAGKDWSVAAHDGSLRLEKDGAAKVWTTITPKITDQGSVRIALSDTKWRFFIFGGGVSNTEARDKVLEEVGKHLRPPEVDDDDIREYQEKKAELARMKDRLVRMEALPSAADANNAKKLRDYREKIVKLERKLSSKDFAGARSVVEPQPSSLAEQIGRTLRPDGSDAVAFDLPLPAGIRVESVKATPEGLLVKIAGTFGAVVPVAPVAPPPSPAWAPPPAAPVVPAPVPTGGPHGTVFLPIGNLGQAIAAT